MQRIHAHKELLSRPTLNWELAKTVEECEQVIEESKNRLDCWQAEHKPIIMMCPPIYYDIVGNFAVAGNGFLESGSVIFHEDSNKNLEMMQNEWGQFKAILGAKGIKVIDIPPKKDLPDQVFVADPSQSYVFIENQGEQLVESHSVTIFSHFAHPGRINETTEVIALFNTLKTNPEFAGLLKHRVMIQAAQKMEGTGDNLIDPYRGIIVSGYGQRNTETALQELEKYTGIPVYGIRSKEPFFHIDTYTCILPGGYVMYSPEVMYEDSIQQLETIFFKNLPALKEKYAIKISKEDADHFACNAVVIGNEVIMQACSDELKARLLAKGFNITFTPAQIANYSGGGLHCMTNKINQPFYYHPQYTLAQLVRNHLLEGKSERQTLSELSQTFDAASVKATYGEVKEICDAAARKIQSHFSLWQQKKNKPPAVPANLIESYPASKANLTF